MYSVTRRIQAIKQPRGGYINRKDFTITTLNDNMQLNETENISPSLIGLAIDYLTRYYMGASKESAFEISLRGAFIAKDNFTAHKLLSDINDLDSKTVISACQLAGYDVCYRAGMPHFKPVQQILPDHNTIQNIIIMVKRCLSFWEQYGPITKDGFTFEGGYTSIISSGDGDYLTSDTLWDFKVLKSEITPRHTLQLLIYYIMGKHSIHKEFQNIKQLGIYNPRMNKIYIIRIADISQSIIDIVSKNVIGYGLSNEEEQKELSNWMEKSKITPYRNVSPSIEPSDCLNKDIYGFVSKKEYISNSFPPIIPIKDYTLYDSSPIFWSGNNIPNIITQNHLPYIIRFNCRFYIKPGKTPFITNKTSSLYPRFTPLSTSDIRDSATNIYYSHYKNLDGELVTASLTLILTYTDFELFKNTYDIVDFKILDGCYFQ